MEFISTEEGYRSDMKNATGDEIRADMETYIKYARVAYLQMLKAVYKKLQI